MIPGFGLIVMALRIALFPVGDLDRHDLDALARDLAAAGLETVVADGTELPPDAFDPARGQFRADVLLEIAHDHAHRRPGEYALAVTGADLYAHGLNFVFGMAETSGRAAVISLSRLRLGADADTFRRRALKEAIHEIGHTLGLGHCPDPDCVMWFSNTLAETDRKRSTFCATCRQRLGERV